MTTPPTRTSARPTRSSANRMRLALRRARIESSGLLGRDVDPRMGAAIGLAIGAVAIVLKAGLNIAIGGDSGFIVLMASIVGAGGVAGLAAGLTAALATAILNTLVFVAPEAGPDGSLSLVVAPLDLARVAVFIVGGVVVSTVIASLRTSRDRLASSLAAVASMAADIERRDERLELVLAGTRTGFWEWDIRTGELVWSRAIFGQHGLDPQGEAPSFERYLETIHPEDREAFEASIQAALDQGGTFSTEFRILWKDGSVHWTHGVGRVFRDAAGQPIRMVGTGQDVTEPRRLAAERDRLLEEEHRVGAFREAFIDVISHELRTPITTILGLTQILARPGRAGTTDDQDGLIADIAAESERLHRLVEDLLVLTKAERGQISIEDEPIEPRRLLERIVAQEATRLPTLSISADIPEDLPIVGGEDTYVEQIVRNILGNAAKYTPPGTAVVVRATHEGDVVVIRVLDSGPGIGEAISDRAFELFFRDPKQARTVAGSGIGLFVCASLVRAMGGTIWAKPRPEGGAEFGFTLRVIDDDELGAPATSTTETTILPASAT